MHIIVFIIVYIKHTAICIINIKSNGGNEMAKQKIEIDVVLMMMEFVEMLSKQDDEKRNEIIEFFEKESSFKLPRGKAV